jgi:hypothetical protein
MEDEWRINGEIMEIKWLNNDSALHKPVREKKIQVCSGLFATKHQYRRCGLSNLPGRVFLKRNAVGSFSHELQAHD